MIDTIIIVQLVGARTGSDRGILVSLSLAISYLTTNTVRFTRRDNGVLLILTYNGNVTSQLKLFTFLRGMAKSVGRLFSVLSFATPVRNPPLRFSSSHPRCFFCSQFLSLPPPNYPLYRRYINRLCSPRCIMQSGITQVL